MIVHATITLRVEGEFRDLDEAERLICAAVEHSTAMEALTTALDSAPVDDVEISIEEIDVAPECPHAGGEYTETASFCADCHERTDEG